MTSTPRSGDGRACDDTAAATEDSASTEDQARTEDSTGGDDRTTAGTATAAGTPDLGAVLELLRTAPPEVRDWLFAQTAGETGTTTGAASAGAGGGAKAAAGSGAGEVAAASDAAGDAAGADGDDAAGGSAGADRPGRAGDAEEADDGAPDPMDEDDADDDILTRRGGERAGAPGKIGRSGRWVIALAVVAGVVFGVWYAGRPAAQAEGTASTTTPTMSSAVPDEDAEARIAELTAAVDADPEDTSARLELGVLLFNAGQTEQAGEHWLAVTELAPDEQEAWYNLGFYYVSTEPADYEAAADCWERVVEIDPGSELASVASMHLGGVMGSGETATPESTTSSGADETTPGG